MQEKKPYNDYKSGTFEISKSSWTGSHTINMFSIIDNAVASGSFEFDKDTSDLKKAIFTAFQDTLIDSVQLTESQAETFRQCAHAAYFLETEKRENGESKIRQTFISNHEEHFR